MGSEDLHHRRKAKKISELKRKRESKAEYETVLIICEGEKTEPLYFLDLINDLKLKTANIKVLPSVSTCPLQLVQYAREKALEDDYDYVYLVFDKDKHSNYDNAIREIENLGAKFIKANSVPCFEYWLLLHFEYTDAPFYTKPSKSSGEEAVQRLKLKIPGYRKAKTGVYSEIKSKTDIAVVNARRANASARNSGTDNPSTNVVDLVALLKKIGNEIDL